MLASVGATSKESRPAKGTEWSRSCAGSSSVRMFQAIRGKDQVLRRTKAPDHELATWHSRRFERT